MCRSPMKPVVDARVSSANSRAQVIALALSALLRYGPTRRLASYYVAAAASLLLLRARTSISELLNEAVACTSRLIGRLTVSSAIGKHRMRILSFQDVCAPPPSPRVLALPPIAEVEELTSPETEAHLPPWRTLESSGR
jgi:hypothetical protein